ncbi:hypothetical protein EGP64_03400 [bacterium]|nr:hypothetical protein [bacterium]
MNKSLVFEKEFNYIKNPKYVENVKILIDLLPDYFFKVAASSTGKYHPSFSLGEGGLVRHTKAAVRIANELLENNSLFNGFTRNEKDLLICSLLIHDGLKHGKENSEYTVFDHPLQISRFVRENKDKLTFNEEEINFICSAVETHMGEWTRDYKGNEILQKPTTKYQKFVHMCDFLSSRKFLDIKFEENEIVG